MNAQAVKKSERVGLRLDPDLKETLEAAAARQRVDLSDLLRILGEEYANALNRSGRNVLWPPEFAMFEPSAKVISTKENFEQPKAAEKVPEFGPNNKGRGKPE